jgi:hypothetical protein
MPAFFIRLGQPGLFTSPGLVAVSLLGFAVFVASAVSVVYTLFFTVGVTLVSTGPTDDVILVDLLGFHLVDGIVVHVAHNFGLYVCFRLHPKMF